MEVLSLLFLLYAAEMNLAVLQEQVPKQALC